MKIEKSKVIRVLVAHEQCSYVELMRSVAEMNSHIYDMELIHAPTRDLALELHATKNPSIVLLDAHLPEQGGLSLIEEFRKQGTPIVVTSTFNSQEIEESAMQYGATGYCALSDDPEILDIVLLQIADYAVEIEHFH